MSLEAWLGILAVVLAVIVPLLLWRLSPKQVPEWARDSRVVWNPKESLVRLKVTFDDEEVTDTLSLTTIVFWNAGRETIKGDDVSELEPLRIKMDPTTRVPHYGIVEMQQTRDACGFTGTESQKKAEKGSADSQSINLNFARIKGGEGCQVRIVHTGNADGITVVGDFDNAAPLRYIGTVILDPQQRRVVKRWITRSIPAAVVVIIGAAGYLLPSTLPSLLAIGHLPILGFVFPTEQPERPQLVAAIIAAAIWVIGSIRFLWRYNSLVMEPLTSSFSVARDEPVALVHSPQAGAPS